MDKIIELTLPEFAFVEGAGHEKNNILEGRNVILHVRSASVLEVFPEEEVHLKPDTLSYCYEYTNQFGATEHMVMFLHYSALLDKDADRDMIIKEVLIPAAKWFCDYCTWEDERIVNDSPYKSKLN